MFDIGFQEILLIGVLALLVFGPSKLPELGRIVGRVMREFRRASDEFRTTVETNLHMNEPDPVSESTPFASGSVTEPASLEPAPTPGLSSVEGAAAETPAASDEASTEPFCAQRGSKIFHRRDCAWVKRIPEIDRLYFKQLADARDQGLATCPVCEPWEPA